MAKRRSRLFAFLMVPFLLAVIGYASWQDAKEMALDPAVAVMMTATSKDGHKIHAACAGVYIGHNTVITAKHCVTGEDEITVNGIDVVADDHGKSGEKVPATILWEGDNDDVAALHIDKVPAMVGTARFLPSDVAIGTPIEVVGTPLFETFIHTFGHVAGIVRSETDLAPDWRFALPIDALVNPGNSGGPVFIKGTHEVIGILVGIRMNVLHTNVADISVAVPGPGGVIYAISSKQIVKLLQEHANDKVAAIPS